ncbi:MAG: GNAT family N-acetyltransferase [Haloarculaceae archaeon]
MSRGRVLTSSERDEWVEVYRQVGRPGVYHHPDYLAMLAGNYEFDAERPEAFVYEADGEVVYYPYLRRPLSTARVADADVSVEGYSDIVSSWYYGGPFASVDDEALVDGFVDAFDEYCRETGIVAEFVRFDPNEENHRQFDTLDPSFNRETVPVDLTGSEDDIWAGYEDRNQRAIRQARDTDLAIAVSDDPEDVARFHDIYTNAMDARDAAPHYRFEQSFFEELVASELFTLLVARHGDEVVGGFIAAHDERRGYHYLSSSNPDYWDMRVNNLLYHEVVMHMHDTGRDVFDFQGGRPGVFKFKKGFSPERGEFHLGRRVHDEAAYERLVDAAAEQGIDTDSEYFPAYRVEQSN